MIITLNIRCTRVDKTVLISAVQNWKQYVQQAVGVSVLKDYLAPPIKNLPEFSEIKFDCKTEVLLDQVLQFKHQSDFA